MQELSSDIIAPDDDEEGACSAFCSICLTVLSWIFILLTMPLSLFVCFKIVTEYERAVIFRLGRIRPGGPKGPGLFFVIPCTDTYEKVDLRTLSFDVPPQEVLTRDSVTITVDAVVFFRVRNPTMAVCNVVNYNWSTRLLAQTTLRNVLGTKLLSEVLSEREVISGQMQQILDLATDPWGIQVERVEV
jgi:erythrocyte band 7 integral membrane protein